MFAIEVSLFLTTIFFIVVLCLVVALFGERIRNAIREGTRQMRELGIKKLALRRQELAQTISVAPPEEVIPRLNQIALDVTGEPAGIDQVLRVETEPPCLVALGKDFAEYAFAPDGPGKKQKRVRRYRIDALSADLFVVEELEAIYRLLARERTARPDEIALPRTERWELIVTPQSRLG
jgi:hypothetical protein